MSIALVLHLWQLKHLVWVVYLGPILVKIIVMLIIFTERELIKFFIQLILWCLLNNYFFSLNYFYVFCMLFFTFFMSWINFTHLRFFHSFHQSFFPVHELPSKSHNTLQAEWNPINHCSPLFNTWNNSQKDEIIRIAESAIDSITQLSNIVGRSNPAPVPAPSSVTPAVCTQKMPLNFTADFQHPAWQPHKSLTVSKDVIVIEYEHDRVPSKAEKIKLEKSKQVPVISGFEVNREWSVKELERERVVSVVERHSDGRILLWNNEELVSQPPVYSPRWTQHCLAAVLPPPPPSVMQQQIIIYDDLV